MTITIKNYAEYCRDYIDLISPKIISQRENRITLPEDVLNIAPLIEEDGTIDYEDSIALPIHLDTKSVDVDLFDPDLGDNDNEQYTKNLAIARSLDDIYRKHETNSYTKQLALHFGQISFWGIPRFENLDDEVEGENKHKAVEGFLFSVPIALTYHDASGRRTYKIIIDDPIIKTNIGVINNYVKSEYRDELFRFISEQQTEEHLGLPLNPEYLDELWTKVVTYLKYSDAKNISETPSLWDACIVLEPKVNYFLSQDLAEIIRSSNDDDLFETSLSSLLNKNEKDIVTEIDDSGKYEVFFPFDYDKSQLEVLSVIHNKGVVVEGPPGTGKSQTIANLLVHLACINKSVLFVSQKDQAIRGVKDKLKSLEIPFIFGYIPDRTSKLHTKDDERDGAAYALRGIAKIHLTKFSESNPTESLELSSSRVKDFNTGIDESRRFCQLLNERDCLSMYDFGEFQDRITKEWYEKITFTKQKIADAKKHFNVANADLEVIRTKIVTTEQSLADANRDANNTRNDFFIKTGYPWLENEAAYLRIISYHELANITTRTLSSFEDTVLDRKQNAIASKVNQIHLHKVLKQQLAMLPQELYDTYVGIAVATKSKTQRSQDFIELQDYFTRMADLQYKLEVASKELHEFGTNESLLVNQIETLEVAISHDYSKLKRDALDDISMMRLEELIVKNGDFVFQAIDNFNIISKQIHQISAINPNMVRKQVSDERQQYKSKVKIYIRNRLMARAELYRSEKKYRAALESIARRLEKTKKAYKTFDGLKSDPFNFSAMSAVTPIWMMSLDDASRILPLSPNLFDYVIFDEASQCNISYALPVMYRAKHTIFFGDTLQMRDSTVSFKSNDQLNALALKHQIPEDLQIKAEGDSVKSVMDITKLAGFKTVYLRRHYRSPKELIGFSNHYFYAKNGGLEVVNDEILTTDDGRIMKTHIIQVNDNLEISDKTNISEAKYISHLIDMIRKRSETSDKSIAVLTFFNEQAELLRRYIRDETIKISTIEGIQGDERDIIIYSLVIKSPTEKKRYVALTGESGDIKQSINEGRVNVAFSRARLQVHAVTSLHPRIWPDGIWIKRYLEYIETHGVVRRLSISEQTFDSHFEEEVYHSLIQALDLGRFDLITQVGSCGFKIDLVVRDGRTGKKLAIECDGPTHFEDGDDQVRVENDFERQAVLETAKWSFYRISYIDWYKDKGAATTDLCNFIHCYFPPLSELDEVNEPATPPIPEKEVLKSNSGAVKIDKDATPDSMGDPIAPSETDKNQSPLKPSTGGAKKQPDQGNEQLEFERIHGTLTHVGESGNGTRDSKKIDKIIVLLNSKNVECVDNRDKKGNLWIIGGHELDSVVQECKKEGVAFRFKAGGGKATGGRDAWWTK